MQNYLTRLDVIKTLLVTTAISLTGKRGWAAKVVGEVTANAIDPTTGVAHINLSSFASLNTNGGSVRLGSSNITPGAETRFPVGLFYPIIINRISATEYVALEANCLHAGCVVSALTGGANGKMRCPCHGSEYDLRGKCTLGPAPVGFSLLNYPVSLSNGILTLRIPDQGFKVTQIATKEVLQGAERRLEISWESFLDVEYEVRYRPSFQTEPVVVPLGLAAENAIDGLSPKFVKGKDDFTTVWVLPQDGILQVAIRLRAL
jgi:Rieske Fe-S protein